MWPRSRRGRDAVHLLEEVFFAVARQVDWDELAAVATRSGLSHAPATRRPTAAVALDAARFVLRRRPRE